MLRVDGRLQERRLEGPVGRPTREERRVASVRVAVDVVHLVGVHAALEAGHRCRRLSSLVDRSRLFSV